MKNLKALAWVASTAGLLVASAAGAPEARAARATAADTTAAEEALDSLVETERAFSAASVERGMKDAFLEYLAQDGVMFLPGPVNGRKRWASRPAPKATLIWAPAYAEASATGDLGLSLGPWELRPPKGEKGDVAHGTFVSIWQRDDDQPWRLAVDLGVAHPRPERALAKTDLEPGPLHVYVRGPERRPGLMVGGAVFGRHLGFGVGMGDYVSSNEREFRSTAHETHRMMTAERNYAFRLRGKGAEEALHLVAADDVRLFRAGAAPARGLVESAATLEARPRRVEFVPAGKGVADAHDLGYSFGLARRWAEGGGKPDSASYLHVWRREPGGDWKLLVDVENPYPKR